MEDIGLVVTLCREERCPFIPGEYKKLSWPLPDPAAAPDDEIMEAFRAARDELLRRLTPMLKEWQA